MGIAERKLRQKEEVKNAILHAAWKIVAHEGWQSLSIRKIAEAIEYSVPVIYDHFQNKEAILLEFTRQGYHQLTTELRKPLERYSTPEQQIEAMAFGYWDFAFHNREYYQLMFGLGMPGCETVKQVQELSAFTELMLKPIKEIISKGGNPTIDPFLKLYTFWSMLHGLVSINMLGKEVARNELNEMVLKDFIRGFISGMKN